MCTRTRRRPYAACCCMCRHVRTAWWAKVADVFLTIAFPDRQRRQLDSGLDSHATLDSIAFVQTRKTKRTKHHWKYPWSDNVIMLSCSASLSPVPWVFSAGADNLFRLAWFFDRRRWPLQVLGKEVCNSFTALRTDKRYQQTVDYQGGISLGTCGPGVCPCLPSAHQVCPCLLSCKNHRHIEFVRISCVPHVFFFSTLLETNFITESKHQSWYRYKPYPVPCPSADRLIDEQSGLHRLPTDLMPIISA